VGNELAILTLFTRILETVSLAQKTRLAYFVFFVNNDSRLATNATLVDPVDDGSLTVGRQGKVRTTAWATAIPIRGNYLNAWAAIVHSGFLSMATCHDALIF
jgi:hypothetical protein